jgi:hypothetical protein
VLTVKKISTEATFVYSYHTKYTLFPSGDKEICGSSEEPTFSLRLSSVINVWPLSLLAAKKISEIKVLPVFVSSLPTTYTLFPDEEIWELDEAPRRAIVPVTDGAAKLVPLS